MLLSVHVCDVGLRKAPGLLRSTPKLAEAPGLRYAQTTFTAPLGGGLLPKPTPGQVLMLAAWDNDDALERFCAEHPIGRRLAGGWQVRLRPLHVYGHWSALPGLLEGKAEAAEDEPVAVLTLGRPRLGRLLPFLRASAPAEAAAVAHPGALATTGMARPPGFVGTFSLWRDVASMRDYARGSAEGAHPRATNADRAKPFHHESAFIRFQPYAPQGLWNGRDPLAEVQTTV